MRDTDRFSYQQEDEMLKRQVKLLISATMSLVGLLATSTAMAENIAVGNYGSSANGMPFAVALAKGYFQQEGANVTGIIASEGGGTSVRNAMAGVAYGEANPGAIAVAIQQGADIKIVSDNVLTIAEFAWMVKKDSPIKTLKDLKGKKIGYTNPRSTSQALAVLLLEKAGYKPEDAELVKTGGFGPMLAALELDQIDVAAVTEPLWSKVKDKYRVLVTGAEALPPLDNVVGMTTGEAARTRGDFIRAVIRARRRAVEFMIANPDEAGDIVAKPFNITPEVARSAVRNLTTSFTQGIPYWGNGQIHLAGMKRIIEVQKSVGAITGEIDLSKMIDTQFLPDDIKTPK
jgi:NitT/TauT family transport system substrate-binding protein